MEVAKLRDENLIPAGVLVLINIIDYYYFIIIISVYYLKYLTLFILLFMTWVP